MDADPGRAARAAPTAPEAEVRVAAPLHLPFADNESTPWPATSWLPRTVSPAPDKASPHYSVRRA
ncbi:hypothetical protein ACIRSJ_27435 [Streptomyces virginiae]|uniref:hypothetical protein n=1 Tax=Streptomyces virginiae TaxID=1961 RepID=UPI00381B9875